ncbi:hypothetical protein [Microbacterium sp.]|uniref:hypothetical protein n=1 Tax=Microbacterium sp. TaxID=51671 RepID=UPI0037C6982F
MTGTLVSGPAHAVEPGSVHASHTPTSLAVSDGSEFGEPYCESGGGASVRVAFVTTAPEGRDARISYGVDGTDDYGSVDGHTDEDGYFAVNVPISEEGLTVATVLWDAGFRNSDESIQWVYTGDKDWTFPEECARTGESQPDPTEPGAFDSLDPARLLDTRVGNGAPQTAVAANGTIDLQVTGRGGVPSTGVAAVVVNVTVVGAATGGFLTVYPSGTTQPTASNLNYTPGQTIPNLVTVKIGTAGKIKLTNNSAGTIHLIADVAGYYLAGTTVG